MSKNRIIIGIFISLFLFPCYAVYREWHIIYMFRSNKINESSACDESLWQYNPEPEEVVYRCITVTGTVVSMKPEADGDENIRLRPDPEYVHLLNIRNIFEQWGELAIEPICENTPTRESAAYSCDGYKSKLVLPHVGDRVAVTGSYTRDRHGWMEIHPVTKFEVIK